MITPFRIKLTIDRITIFVNENTQLINLLKTCCYAIKYQNTAYFVRKNYFIINFIACILDKKQTVRLEKLFIQTR